jgi:hypothetical protein
MFIIVASYDLFLSILNRKCIGCADSEILPRSLDSSSRDKALSLGRRQQIHFKFHAQHVVLFWTNTHGCIPAGAVQNAREYTRMNEAVLLRECRPICYADFDLPMIKDGNLRA